MQFSPMPPQPLATGSLPQRHIATAVDVSEQAKAQQQDIWSHLSKGYGLTGYEQPRVRQVARRHAAHPSATRHTLRRAEPFLWEIIEQVESRGMPLEIALLPAIETRFNPSARSPRGAAGLWQFLPRTGAMYGLNQDWWHDARLDTVASTHAALDYLGYLHNRFDDWLLALAAYNAGEARVAVAIKKNRRAGKLADYWHIKLPEETRNYIPRLLGLADLIRDPDAYGFLLPKISDANEFTVVKLQHQLDLTLAAELSGISLLQLRRYNPALKHWTTGPRGNYQLVMPKHEGAILRKALAALPADSWMTWKRYRIRKGDSLGVIAERYGSTISILRRINNLKGDYLRAGNSLLVPVPRHTGQLVAAGLSVPAALKEQQPTRVAETKKPGTGVAYAPKKHSARSGTHQIRYQIQSGDNLSAIAQAYDVNVEALAGWNNLKPGAILRPGRMLTIWIGKRAKLTGAGKAF